MKTSILLLSVLALSSMGQFMSIKESLRAHVKSQELVVGDPDWANILHMFMTGANLTDLVVHSQECVDNSVYFLGNATKSISEFYKKPTTNNWFGVTEDLALLTPTIKSCFDSMQEGNEQFYAYLKKFNFNAGKWGRNFQANAQANFAILAIQGHELYNAFADKDWGLVSYKTGRILQTLLDFEPLVKADLLESKATELHEIVDGFLSQTQVLNTTQVQNCTDTARWYVDSWEKAIAAFKKQDMKTGWDLVADSFSQIYPLNYNCAKGSEEIANILVKHFDFNQPWNIAYEIGAGLKIIHLQTIAAKQAFAKKQYR